MTDLAFVILAAAFIVLIAETAQPAPHQPGRLCAIHTLPASCGDVR